MSNTLYFTTQKDAGYLQVLIALQYLGTTLNVQKISKKYDPLILVTSEGALAQSNTILRYIVGEQMIGETRNHQSLINQWFQYLSNDFVPIYRQISGQISGDRPTCLEKYNYAIKQVQRILENINNHLKLRTFMVGDSVSILDISLVAHLELIFTQVVGEQTRKKVPNVVRWFSHLRSTPPVINILNDLKWCAGKGFSAEKSEVVIESMQ